MGSVGRNGGGHVVAHNTLTKSIKGELTTKKKGFKNAHGGSNCNHFGLAP